MTTFQKDIMSQDLNCNFYFCFIPSFSVSKGRAAEQEEGDSATPSPPSSSSSTTSSLTRRTCWRAPNNWVRTQHSVRPFTAPRCARPPGGAAGSYPFRFLISSFCCRSKMYPASSLPLKEPLCLRRSEFVRPLSGERRLLFSAKLSEMLSLWARSHSSFLLLALNVGCFIENEWRTDKEPSTMAAGAELTRTAVG